MQRKPAHVFLKDAIEAYGYKQGEVACWVGLKRATFNKKLNGRITLSADEFLDTILELRRRGPRSSDAIWGSILSELFGLNPRKNLHLLKPKSFQ